MQLLPSQQEGMADDEMNITMTLKTTNLNSKKDHAITWQSHETKKSFLEHCFVHTFDAIDSTREITIKMTQRRKVHFSVKNARF